MINFKNKKILITGATGGIGNALVKKFVTLEGNVMATGTKTEKLDKISYKIDELINDDELTSALKDAAIGIGRLFNDIYE